MSLAGSRQISRAVNTHGIASSSWLFSAILYSRNQALRILLPSLEMEKEKNRSLNALKMERWKKEKEAKKKEADKDYY